MPPLDPPAATRFSSSSNPFTSSYNMSRSDDALLYTTLGLVLTSFFASAFVVLRSLLPLLPPHPLQRRESRSNRASETRDTPKLRLRSAQRFQVWLAVAQLIAVVMLVWEATVATALPERGLGGGADGASRLYVATTLQPTLLMIVALLTWSNVIQGRAISLGWADSILWVPTIAIVALAAGLAFIGSAGHAVWIALLVYHACTCAITVAAFGRLLVAIARVRQATRSMYGRPRKEAPTDSKRRRFFPFDLPLLTNFSGISTSFVHAIGRSTSSVDLPRPATSIGPGPGAPGPLVAYAPQRYSAEGLASELSVYEHMRDFRSPTPGSAHGLLAMRNTPSPDPSVRDHGPARISFETSTLPSRSNSLDEDPPRPSFTSCSSTSHAPALVGGAAVQRALAAEMRASGPRSTSSRSSVELSHREARAAIIRIGGHFLSSLLSIALLAPFLARRIASPTGVPSLALSILFVVSVTLPAPVLALQVALVEGVWPSPQPQPTESAMSSSTTLADDAMETIKDTEHQHEHARCDSCASASAASLVSIDTVGLAGASSQDVETGTKSRFHRAVSTLSTHPRLMRLDEDATQESYAGASSSLHNGPGFAGSHARRRSVASTHSRTRTESALSQRSVFSTRVRRNTLSGSPRRDSPGCQPPTEEREGSELRISPDYTIDFLSSRVLPRLVPSVRLGADTPIEPEESSFTRRTSLGNDLGPLAPEGRPQSAAGITIFNGSTFGRRNFRNLSLPGIGSARRSLVSEGVQDFEAPNDATATPRPPSALATAASASPSIDIPDAATEAIARALLARRSEAPSKLDDARQTAQGNADQSEILAPTSSSEEAPQTRAGFVPRELRLSRSSSVTSRSARLSTYSSMSSYDDEDPAELGTIHCATIHSVSRPQSALPANSTSHHSLNSRSDDTLEQGAGRPRSHSSITSQGFRNTMRTGRWHDDQGDSSFSSDIDPTPPSRPPSATGLRRLTLLDSRDETVSHAPLGVLDAATGDSSEARPEEHGDKHTGSAMADLRALLDRAISASSEPDLSRPALRHVDRSWYFQPAPPIPEDDEDKRSQSTATPKTVRSTARTPVRAKGAQDENAPPDFEAQVSSPNVTGRGKVRQHRDRRPASGNIRAMR